MKLGSSIKFGDVHEHDISPATHRWSPDNRLNPDTDVMLRVECMSSVHLKVLTVTGNLLRFLCFALLVTFTGLEASNHKATDHKRTVLIAAAIISGGCAAILLAQTIMLVRTLYIVRKQKKRWIRRKARLVAHTGVSMGLILVASTLWMAESTYAASTQGRCREYSTFCRWAQPVVWTMVNCWLFLQLLLAHAASMWTDDQGRLLQHLVFKRRSWLRAAPRPALIFDAPWGVHLPKLIPWLILEASVILEIIGQPRGQHGACLVDTRFDTYTPCHSNNTYSAHKTVAYVGLGVYIWIHFWYIRVGRKHHSILPYTSFRIGLVLMRTQEGSSIGISTFLLTCASWILAVVFKPSACMPCLQASPHLVLILSAVRLIVSQFAFFTPKVGTADDPIVIQEWMQFFVWTEHTKQAKLDERQSCMPPRQRPLMHGRPIFCFETAIKLLYWCGFVYEHDEGRPVLKLSQKTALSLFNLDHFQLVRCEAANVKCLVAWSDQNLVVAFRGTANFTNAIADIKAWMVSEAPLRAAHHTIFQSQPKVHSGFHAAWDVSGLKAAVTKLIQSQITSEAAAKMHVFLTGHSLGGAMANLAAVDVAQMMQWASVQVYTVGAPRTGNHAYAKLYNKLVPDTWGIINYRDPVPKMAKFGFLYARPGNRVLLYPNGDIVVCPTPLDIRLQGYRRCGRVSRHKLTAYRASLVSVLRAQIKCERLEPGLAGVMELADSVALKEVLLDADADMATASLKPNLQNGSSTGQHSGTAQSAPASAAKQPEMHRTASDALTDSKLAASDAVSMQNALQHGFSERSAVLAIPAALQSEADIEPGNHVAYDQQHTELQRSLHVLPDSAHPDQSDSMLHKVVVES